MTASLPDCLPPFRFGLLAAPPAGPAQWRHTARRAEELGYSALLMPDHLNSQWGPIASLAIAAEHTERIALGTLMLITDLRSPVVLYKELATIAQFAPGRLELGMGAGWLSADHAAAGVAFSEPSVRIERLDEAMRILRALWADGTTSFRGQHYDITEASGDPRPPEPAAVKWTLGGGGRKVLEVAARHADIISLSAQLRSGVKDASYGATATAESFDRRVRWVRAATGDRLASVELQCYVFAVAVGTSRARYAARVLSPMFGLPAEQALESPLALAGTVPEICAQLIAHRERFGIGYWVVPGAQLEQFAPVIAELRPQLAELRPPLAEKGG